MSRTPSSTPAVFFFEQAYSCHVPATGFVRQRQLIGEAPVTPEQAAANKLRGKGPRRPRPGCPGVIPWSSATLWRAVKSGAFPPPQKLSPGTSAWLWTDVVDWMHKRAAPSQGKPIAAGVRTGNTAASAAAPHTADGSGV